jgi:hypothetical protein
MCGCYLRSSIIRAGRDKRPRNNRKKRSSVHFCLRVCDHIYVYNRNVWHDQLISPLTKVKPARLLQDNGWSFSHICISCPKLSTTNFFYIHLLLDYIQPGLSRSLSLSLPPSLSLKIRNKNLQGVRARVHTRNLHLIDGYKIQTQNIYYDYYVL